MLVIVGHFFYQENANKNRNGISSHFCEMDNTQQTSVGKGGHRKETLNILWQDCKLAKLFLKMVSKFFKFKIKIESVRFCVPMPLTKLFLFQFSTFNISVKPKKLLESLVKVKILSNEYQLPRKFSHLHFSGGQC